MNVNLFTAPTPAPNLVARPATCPCHGARQAAGHSSQDRYSPADRRVLRGLGITFETPGCVPHKPLMKTVGTQTDPAPGFWRRWFGL